VSDYGFAEAGQRPDALQPRSPSLGVLRAATNRWSVGASGRPASSPHATHRMATCSRHSCSPAATTGTKTIRNREPGSRKAATAGDAEITRRPSSSASSRRRASRSVSALSTFPPGNSHMPPCRFSAARCATRTRFPRSITAATTLVSDTGIQVRGELTSKGKCTSQACSLNGGRADLW
jgi:hypothetical protein